MFHYFDTYYDAETAHLNLPDKKKEELSETWKNGFSKIRKAADSGGFLFSDEAEKALKDFVESMRTRQDSYFEHLDNGYVEVKKCLKRLVDCSKTDLKLKEDLIDKIKKFITI